MATTKKKQELYIGKKLHASNFDELMDQVDLDGKFQRRFNLLYNLVYVVLVAMPYMNLVLVLAVPDHWCYLPGREQTNMSLEQWKAATIPRMDGGADSVEGYSKCQMFNIPTPVNNSDMWGQRDLEVVGCRHGWEYDQTWYATTATSQENWVCDRQLNVAHSFVFSRVGDMVGTFVFGNLGDVIGRRPVFFLSTLIIVVGRCMSIFTSWNYPLFLATIVFGTSTASAVFTPPAIVGMEISSSKKRAHIAMTQCVGLTLGACLAPLIAWATRDWVTYLLLTSLPCAIFFLTPKMFIESPRWLAAKGRNKEAAKVICYIGRVNGKPMQENLVEDNLNMFTEKQEKTYGVASLASSWRLARNTVLIIICWSISSLTVFTLMLNVVNMSGNPFLNYVWQSASELPGYVAGRWISDRFGRRWPPAISFMIATVGFLLMAATTRDPSLQWVTFLTLAVTKMCITVPYYVVFLQAMETYPTSVRQTGTSLGSLASSGIGMLGPYIVYLVHLRGAGARLLNGNLAEYDGHQVQVQITPTDAPCDVMEENEETLFDGLMREVGMNGFFQKRFNVLFNLVLVVFATMSNLNLVFAMAVPGHWCYVPGREETNYTQTQWKQLTLPRENNSRGIETFDNCRMYNLSLPISESSVNISHQQAGVVGCQYGWEYDHTWYSETAPSRSDWVCDKELYVTNTFVASQAGDLVGSFVFGQLGDTIGRRPVFLLTLSLLAFGRSVTTIAADIYPLFLVTCFLGTVATNSICVSTVAVGMEISARDKSSHIAMLQCLGWTAGLCLMPMIAWATGNWMSFLLISSLPSVVFFTTICMFPESPRWLAARGRTTECIQELRRIADANGTEVPLNAVEVLKRLGEKRENTYGFASLFSSWTLARNTSLIMLCWLINMLSYYTLTLNVTNMSGNPFLNFFWQALVELPGYTLGKVFSDRFGRRWTQSIGFVVIVLSCMVLVGISIDPSVEWLTTSMVVFVKFCFTVTNYVIYLQGIEIYPTCIRQSGTSVGTLVSTSLGMLGPYIVYLGSTTDIRYPYIILGLMALLGSVLSAFLPETLNVKLPETLYDAQHFGDDQKFWSIARPPPAKKTKKKHPPPTDKP